MIKTIAAVAAMFLVFAVVSLSQAAQVTGEIKAIDKSAKTITIVKKVKGEFKETVIVVDDRTLAGVKTGSKVTVKFTTANGKNTATSVKAAKKAGAKNTESAKPAEPGEKKTTPRAGGY